MKTKPLEVYTNLFGRFKELGCKIENAIDVGAHEGKWTERLKKHYPDANVYLIDGNDTHKDKCEKLGTFIQAYVDQEEEEKNFYYSSNPTSETGNSLFRENSNIPFKKKKIKTQKLIDIVPDKKYDFIKMDVQGSELEIFEGSLKLFYATKWVQLEVPVFPNNMGAPNFEQIINYMANSAFKVFDIENIYYNARLMGIDILFRNTTLPKELTIESDRLEYTL